MHVFTEDIMSVHVVMIEGKGVHEDIISVHVVMIEGKYDVIAKDDLPNLNLPVMVEHAFYYEHLY
jgi:hypothetical protein